MSQFEAGNSLNRVEMSQSLRGSLQRAISYAYEQYHRQVTLEHLLLALVDDRDATAILEASSVNVPALLTEISDYLGRLEDRTTDQQRRQPALGNDIQHIIQSAGAAAEKSKRSAVSSALVLAAIVGEGRSPSAQMLRNHGMTFESAIAALKQVNAAEAARPAAPAVTSEAPQRPSGQAALPAAGPEPAPTANAGIDGARLQNMQAAHEIIASARERIAAARGSVAVHAEETTSPRSPAQPEPSIAAPINVPTTRPPDPEAQRSDGVSRLARATPPQQDVPAAQPDATSDRAPQLAPARVPQPSYPPLASPAPSMQSPRSAPHEPSPQPQPIARSQPVAQPHPVAQPQPVAQPMLLPTSSRQLDPVPPSQQPSGYGRPVSDRAARGAPTAPEYDRAPAGVPEYTNPPSRSPDLSPAARPIEPEKLAEFVPTRMRVGVPVTVEIRAPRSQLEAWSGGYVDSHGRDGQIITKAMVMRLKAPEGGFTVEIASPETQWSEASVGPLSDDVVSWRWTVTPRQRGWHPLQLNVLTRVVGKDGLAAARTLPEQLVHVRVAPNYGRLAARLTIWLFLALSGTALGYYGDRLFSLGSSMLAQVVQ